jgi:heparanase
MTLRETAKKLAPVALIVVARLIAAQPVSLAPGAMPRVGTVDQRFQSYNIEMVEVTGGRFWKPYASTPSAAGKAPASASQQDAGPAGIDPGLFEYRPPIDLSNARLRKLAAALGPAYVRVSGTWANTLYFHDSDEPAPEKPPTGFNAVLTRKQWKGVVDFARAVDAQIVTSFAFGAGTRDADGVWTPDQARRVLAYTKSAGGSIAAAEFVNEPTFAAIGGAPKGYDAAAFARDVAVFRRFFKEAAPNAVFLGPGSVGEAGVLAGAMAGRLKTEDLLTATGPAFDAFSYHIYPAVSQRCSGAMPAIGTTADAALSRQWLARPGEIQAFYTKLRDRFEPGKPLWLTETADSACGGNAWGATFLDTFRYLHQHGSLAQQGVQVIMHNTLSASDYGLIDEKSLDPRPNYWAAVLWRRLMGRVVLSPGVQSADNLYVYAHCQAGRPGGVTVLAINAGKTDREIDSALRGERYTLSATQPDTASVQLNGRKLEAGADGSLPALTSTPTRAGRVPLPPASITFLAFPDAGNTTCK